MTKKVLILILTSLLSIIVYSDRLTEHDNVRYEYNSSTKTLTISQIDSTKEAKIDPIELIAGVSSASDKVIINKGLKLPDDSSQLFYGFSNLIIDPNIDTSNVTNMAGMFYNSNANVDISNWDVSNVTDMSYMFSNSNANVDISNWDVSNVTDMSYMFSESTINPDVSNWDVSNVTDMNHMFYNSTANPNVRRWNVGNVLDMSYMFSHTLNANPDVSNWDVSNVTNMKHMFGNSTANPDVSNWNVSKVKDISWMFFQANKAQPNTQKWNLVSLERASDFISLTVNPDTVEVSSKLTEEDIKNMMVNLGGLKMNDSFPPGTKFRIFESPYKVPGVEHISVSVSLPLSTSAPYYSSINNSTNIDILTVAYKIKQNVRIDQSKYLSKIKKLNQVDTTIIDKDIEGFYIEGNLLHDYYNQMRGVLTRGRFEYKNLLGGLKLGANIKVNDTLSVGPFLEYEFDEFHTVAMGAKLKAKISNNSVLSFVRYRLNVLDLKPSTSLSHNADVYLRHTYDYVNKKFYLRSELSGLFSYGTSMAFDSDVSITDRILLRGDLGLRLGGNVSNTDIYVAPTFTVQYSSPQYLEDKDGRKDRALIRTLILNGILKVGMEHNLGKLRLNEDLSVDYLGNLKANFGFGYNF